MAITQGRQVIQQEPVTSFGPGDFGTTADKKIRRISTSGTGLARKSVFTWDLTGASASLQILDDVFLQSALPVGERQGKFFLVPINYELGKHYTLAMDTQKFSNFTPDGWQWLLTPLGSLSNDTGEQTVYDGIVYDIDVQTVAYNTNNSNLGNVTSNNIGFPMAGTGVVGFTPSNGGFTNLTYTMSRCVRSLNFRITKSFGSFDSAGYIINWMPVNYGDFN